MIDVRSYLEAKNLRVKGATHGNVHLACPFCLEDESKRGRLYVQTEGESAGLFTCFRCGEKGGINKLRAAFGDPPLEDDEAEDDWRAAKDRQKALAFAADYYAERLSETPNVMEYLQRERGLTPETIRDSRLGFADGSLKLSMLNHGIDLDALKSVGLVYPDGREFFIGYITIPYFTGGHVSLIRGRAFSGGDGAAKYKTPLGQSPLLYNSDITFTTEGEITATESEFDCMVMNQLGIPAVGVPGTTAWDEKWADYFKEFRRIYVMFDPDGPGKIGAEKVADSLSPRARIVELPPPDANGTKFDPTELYVTKGWGREEFDSLLAKAKGGLLKTAQDAYDEWMAMKDAEGLKLGYDSLDIILHPGLLGGQVFILGAASGCIAGEAELVVNRGGKGFRITMKDLYEKFHGRLDQGKGWDLSIPTCVSQGDFDAMTVRSGRISDVMYSGLKETVVVHTASYPSKSIRLTTDHRVMTEKGWCPIGSLDVGDKILVNAGRRKNAALKAKSYYPMTCDLKGHPRANRPFKKGGWRVPRHIVVAEADMNGLAYEEYVARLRAGESDFAFVSDDQHVHHVDHDTTNFELGNLQVLSAEEHRKLHAKPENVAERLAYQTIASMTPGGMTMTFDITMAEGGPHFIADNIVVHNSGKTMFLINLMHRLTALNQDAKVLFLSLEQTEHEWFERARRIYRFYNPSKGDIDALRYWKERIWIVDENMLSPTKAREIVEQFALEVGQVPDLIVLDYLGYWARGFKGEAYERTSAAVMALKALAKEFRVPVIAPHQLSRTSNPGEEPNASSLRESGVVLETADFAAFMWSPDQRHGRNADDLTGERLIRLSKSRHGGVGHLFRFRLAPLSLVLLQDHEPDVELAKNEIAYSLTGDSFETALWRHQTGVSSQNLDQYRNAEGRLMTLAEINEQNQDF